MISTTLQRRRAEAIDIAVDQWKTLHHEAMADAEMEVDELVDELIDLVGSFKKSQTRLWDRLFSNQIRLVHRAGQNIALMYNMFEQTILKVEDSLLALEKTGYSNSKAEELRAAFAQFRGLHKEFLDRWPFPDAALMEEARTGSWQGKYRPLEEVFHELQGGAS